MTTSFLIEMAWKSAAISGAALLLVALLRSRSAADRGAVLRVGVVLLLALPAIAALLPALSVVTGAGEPAAPPAALAAIPMAEATAPGASLPAVLASAEPTGNWNDPSVLFLLLYLGGVAAIAGRLVAGLWTLRRWTRESSEVTEPRWLDALARNAGTGSGIRLLACDEASSPLSWGWRRPVILLDRDTIDRPENADAILAHETAHIERGDWPSLILSRLTVALFWFNPLVWRLDREVAHQAEEAADSHAAAAVEPARYAQALLDWARQSAQALPANAMAGSEPGLSRRVKALLDGRFKRRSGSFWTFAAIAGCVAVAAPVAALEFVDQPPPPPEAPEAPLPPPAPEAGEAPDAPPAPAAAIAPPAPAAAAAPNAPGTPPAPPSAHVPPAPRMPHLAMLHPVHPVPPVPPVPVVDGEQIRRDVEAALLSAGKSRSEALATSKHAAEAAVRAARSAIANGADGMLKGADGMEKGAERMRAEAARLRNKDYREQQIARAAARGDKVTHEELLEAARGLEEGAEGMREGAREMRKSAAEMRRGG